MAETPVQENRQRGERKAVVARDDVRRAGSFGHVEIAIADETPVPGGRIHVGENGEVYAVRLDRPLLQRTRDFVIAAGERQRNFFRHVGLVIAASVGVTMGQMWETAVKPAFGAKSSPFAALSAGR